MKDIGVCYLQHRQKGKNLFFVYFGSCKCNPVPFLYNSNEMGSEIEWILLNQGSYLKHIVAFSIFCKIIKLQKFLRITINGSILENGGFSKLRLYQNYIV